MTKILSYFMTPEGSNLCQILLTNVQRSTKRHKASLNLKIILPVAVLLHMFPVSDVSIHVTTQ